MYVRLFIYGYLSEGNRVKKIYYIFLITLIFGILSLFRFYKNKKTKYTIGIIQCASFPPIDEAVRNFMIKTKALFGENEINFIFANAENSPVNAHAIAQRFITNRNIDAFFTTDTATTQAIFSLEKNRPIVFMAVEKPEEIGLVYQESNACGITDKISPETVRELIELIPDAKEKKIGLLAKNETSRKLLLDEVSDFLVSSGYTVSMFTPLNEMELIEQLRSILSKVDILLSPVPDSMVGATMSLIAKETKEKKIPFLVCLEHGARCGALASSGVNYAKNGIAAADMLFAILEGEKKPYHFSVQQGSDEHIFVNCLVAKNFNIKESKKIIFC